MPDDEFDEEKEETTTHEPYPFFENETLTSNVTTQLGSNVYLHCRVNNLGKNTVSSLLKSKRLRYVYANKYNHVCVLYPEPYNRAHTPSRSVNLNISIVM